MRDPLSRRSLGFARDDKGKGDTSMKSGGGQKERFIAALETTPPLAALNRKRRPLLCHPERSRGICGSADLSWKCFRGCGASEKR